VALRRSQSKVIEESFELILKTVSGDTTMNGQGKGVPNSWSGNSEAAGTETCADTGNEQQFRVRRTPVPDTDDAHETSHLFQRISVLIQRYNAVAFRGSFVKEDDDVSG